MPKLLAGLHDREGASQVPDGGWCLDTVALSENPVPPQYDTRIDWIARLNWGYGSTGTLPTQDRYNEFATRVAAYVAGSRGCSRWIIGNEPNLRREWPDDRPILPHLYAACYSLCREAIHALPGHAKDEVLVAASGPWNAELKYPGNPNGDWIKYFTDVLAAVGDCDGFSLHAYTHGYNVALVTSSARMQAPFQSRHYEFRTYWDYIEALYIEALPASVRDLPIYITEANGNGPWQAVGLIPAMLNELENWNKGTVPKVNALVFYRYPRYDNFHMEGRGDVMAEFKAAASRYQRPAASTVHLPSVPGGSMPALPAVVWDPRLDKRGIKLTQYQPKKGETYFRIVRGEYWEEKEHTFAETLDKDGKRLPGVTMRWWWADGDEHKRTEAKPGDRWMVDFPMYTHGHSYGLEALGYPSDKVFGMGLGSWEKPDWNIHVSYKFVYQLTVAEGVTDTGIGEAPKPVTPPAKVPALTHPVQDPAKRIISQRFGENPQDYAQFGLAGHAGLDFAVPTGTLVVAVDDGQVQELGDGTGNYGIYVKLRHVWGESLYAHLDRHASLGPGVRVAKGQLIGHSGNTGNSTGPHLHFAMRILPYKRGYPHDGFSNPELYLPKVVVPQPSPSVDILAIIKAAAQEFKVEWQLLASLAWGESSWRPDAVSSAGAKGLFQIMDGTFAEWGQRVGAGNALDPRDNARVGAAYLASLIKHFGGDVRKGLWAYNYGIGNISAGRTPPQVTIEFATKVLHGRDLLKAVL